MINKKTKKNVMKKKSKTLKNNKYSGIKYIGGFLRRFFKSRTKSGSISLNNPNPNPNPTLKTSPTKSLKSRLIPGKQRKDRYTLTQPEVVTKFGTGVGSVGSVENSFKTVETNVSRLINPNPNLSVTNARRVKHTLRQLSPAAQQNYSSLKRKAPLPPDTNTIEFNYKDNPFFRNPELFVEKNPQEVLNYIKNLDTFSNTAKQEFINKNPQILNYINNSIAEQSFGFNEQYQN
jgi:hypothetical protein